MPQTSLTAGPEAVDSRRKFYSQNGEDFLLWSLFGSCESGYFVDVGAFDGIHLSNSYSFELAGWRGVCIEAHPEYYPLLERNRPGSTTVFSACTGPDHPGVVDFLSEPLGLLSGVEADRTTNMHQRYESRGMAFPGWKTVTVPAGTLDSILDRAEVPAEMSFLTVDTEGTEPDVLAGLDFGKRGFRAIVVEANTRTEAKCVIEILTFSKVLPCSACLSARVARREERGVAGST
jgi:FkbM family methyltransferase